MATAQNSTAEPRLWLKSKEKTGGVSERGDWNRYPPFDEYRSRDTYADERMAKVNKHTRSTGFGKALRSKDVNDESPLRWSSGIPEKIRSEWRTDHS